MPILSVQTGASKHYAWVEFKHASVAKIAAEAIKEAEGKREIIDRRKQVTP